MDALVSLFDAYRQFHGKPSDEAAGRSYLGDRLERQDSVLYVAEDDQQRPVGFAQLYPSFSSVSLARTFVLNDLYVDPSCRHVGIGSALLKAVVQHAKDAGALRVTASTAIENTTVQRLNERNGMVRDRSFYVYHIRTF
ncbi:GNAT family N-acetyltransferase [Ramlibacter solisilvae]